MYLIKIFSLEASHFNFSFKNKIISNEIKSNQIIFFCKKIKSRMMRGNYREKNKCDFGNCAVQRLVN